MSDFVIHSLVQCPGQLGGTCHRSAENIAVAAQPIMGQILFCKITGI